MNKIEREGIAKEDEERHFSMPDLPRILAINQQTHCNYDTQQTPPPISTTDYSVTENGNSSPALIRSTIYSVGKGEYFLKASSVPFSVLLSPFHERGIVDELETIDRCSICRSYANNFTKIIGNNAFCNICGSIMNITDPTALSYSSMECVKPQVSTQISPVFVFVIDMAAGQMVRQALGAIRSVCFSENFQVLYKNVTFLVLNGEITTFKAEVIDENSAKDKSEKIKQGISQVSLKANNRSSFSLIKLMGEFPPKFGMESIIDTQNAKAIADILDFIENMTFKGKTREKFYMDLIKDICSLSSACNVALFSNADSIYNYEEFLNAHKNICINLFKVKQGTSEAKSLEKLAFYSSGRVFFYDLDLDRISIDLMQVACTKSVFCLNIMLKTCNSITKTDVIAPTLNSNFSNLYLNHMDPNCTVIYNLNLDEQETTQKKYIQALINYTDYDGTRKMRLLNLEILYGDNFYNNTSVDAIFASFVKQKLDEDIDIDLELVKILAYYRKSQQTYDSQLVMPDALNILPVLVQAYPKKDKMDSMFLYRANCEQVLRYFYPRMVSLSDYSVDPMCKALRLTHRNIVNGEIYVLENSLEIIFFFTQNVDEDLVNSIFVQDTNVHCLTLESFRQETDGGILCINLICDIQNHYNYPLKLSMIQAGEAEEATFMSFMVEDAINDKPTYPQYIYSLHNNIKNY